MFIILPALSGLLYALAFPKFDLWWLAFIWPLPLYAGLAKARSAKGAFFTGWISGLAAFLILLYWVPMTVSAGGGHPLVSVSAWAALSAYLALFFGLYALAASRIAGKGILAPFAAASAWVLSEWLRAHLLGGFPWSLLGYSLTHSLSLLQWAEFGGVYFLGFLPMLVSILLWSSYQRFVTPARHGGQAPAGSKTRLGEVQAWIPAFAGMTILLFCWVIGSLRVRQLESQLKLGPTVAVLQGNINQYEKWEESRADAIISVYQDLAHRSESQKPDMVIWPETSWPYLEAPEGREGKNVEEVLKTGSIPHLIGVIISEEGKIFNSALLVQEGAVRERYDKGHLVPFGEYVPLSRLFRRWFGVLNAIGETSAGESPKPLQWRGFSLGVSICYESIFPEISTSLARQGAKVLVNLTNDGWYLDTAAPYQHFQMNIVRAVENRMPLVRAANTGISGIIDPIGRVHARTELNERTVLISDIPILKP